MGLKKDKQQKEEKQERRKKTVRVSSGRIRGVKKHTTAASVSTTVPPISDQGFLTKQAAILEIGPFKDSNPDQKLPRSEETASEDKYLYVYGIVDNTDIKLNLKGLRDAPIAKINFKDVGVLFSFYPVLHPLIEEKEALLHAEILNKIAEKVTIIPMAFGTVFKDQEILEVVLEKSYPQVQKTLGLIKDKIELGIKVVKKEAEEEISTAVNQEILEELNKLSAKSVAGDKFSERLLLNNSFLVEKNKFSQFSEKIGELEEKHHNVKFLYTGPWPAYSFVDINIKVG